MKKIKLKILKKGDVVINSFSLGENVALAIKRKSGKFEIVTISRGIENIPEVSAIWEIEEGDNEVTIEKDGVAISTF